MRRFMYLLIAAILGAGSYFAYHEMSGPKAPPPAAVDLAGGQDAPKAPLSPVAPGPILSEDMEGPAQGTGEETSGEEAAGEAPREKTADGKTPEGGAGLAPAAYSEKGAGGAGTTRGIPAAKEPQTPAAEAIQKEIPGGAPLSPDIDAMIRRSQAAFAAGDNIQGTRILREIFQAARDRPDVSIVSQVRQLLEVEERGANDRPAAAAGGQAQSLRLDLCRYIEGRDSDPAWRFRACLALGTAEAGEVAPEVVRAAWKDLSQAYLAASGSAERLKVLAVLNPFLKKHIFSKRYSPLVETYTVKAGDSLNRIARARGTTEDAIQRLNQLKGTTIQPGQRLIILPGKPKVFVKKSEYRLWVLVGDRFLMECPVGLGKENSTPAATFVIRDRIVDPVWYRQGEAPIPAGDPRNILGSRWLGFKNTEELSGFGIHGTSDPSSIGKEASSGCIRMKNDEIEILFDLVPAGTEVEISE